MIEGKLDCTSADEKDIVFDTLQKRYGRGCVRQYCQKLCIIHQISSWDIRQLGDIRRTVEDLQDFGRAAMGQYIQFVLMIIMKTSCFYVKNI